LRKYPSVDIIVRGEGEYTCTELAQRIGEGRDLKDVRGITFRKGERIIRTGDRDLIRDLDSLDFPDRRLLNVEYDSKICGLNVASRKFTTIVSSRGCPFRCTFCGCRKFARGLWRVRSVENVVDELEFLQNQGYGQFLFVDDNFTVDHRRVTRFCETLRKRKLDVEWFCDSRVDEVNLEVFRDMVRTGCKNVYFGIESASQRLLNAYKKGTTPDQARKAVKIARKAGIDVIVGSFVVGGEDETREEIAETLRFALELDIDVPTFSVLGAFTGTDLWNDLIAKGFVNEDEHWENGVYVTSVSPHAVPLEEINKMIYNCFVAFVARPEFIGKEVLRTIVSPYRRRVLLNNITHLSEIVKIVKQEITFEEETGSESPSLDKSPPTM
jgi:anaerobic magnesium-protoporphyrin IX monomethyl ester cyclase